MALQRSEGTWEGTKVRGRVKNIRQRVWELRGVELGEASQVRMALRGLEN